MKQDRVRLIPAPDRVGGLFCFALKRLDLFDVLLDRVVKVSGQGAPAKISQTARGLSFLNDQWFQDFEQFVRQRRLEVTLEGRVSDRFREFETRQYIF